MSEIKVAFILAEKFPDHIMDGFIVESDEEGKQFISHWDADIMGEEKPTDETLEGWSEEAQTSYGTAKAKAAIGESILEKLGAKSKEDAIIGQMNVMRSALVEVQKALKGEEVDAEKVAKLNAINDIIDGELNKS